MVVASVAVVVMIAVVIAVMWAAPLARSSGVGAQEEEEEANPKVGGAASAVIHYDPWNLNEDGYSRVYYPLPHGKEVANPGDMGKVH